MNRLNVLVLGCIFSTILFISLVVSVQQSNPLKQFNVTPDSISLNWTNNYASNITITINETFDNIIVEILNDTAVSTNYSQSTSQSDCGLGYKLYVIDVNNSNAYNKAIGPLNATNSSIVTIIDKIDSNHIQCSPGRYWINKLTIRNTTQINETTNITVFIDIPISSLNTLTASVNNANLPTTGVGYFGNGANLPANATNYQSYYFNTSLVTSATGIKINLTGWLSSQDADLFLLDNSSTPILKAKSINTTTSESLLYSYLPQGTMWEIRVYGNSTSPITYNGNIIFTTLNITNTSDSSQQVSSINFGNMDASETKQINITLKNEGNLTLSNVAESKELYFIRTFGGSGPKNFTLLVPDSSIASKVKASLNWTGSSNYSLRIYNQDNSLLVTSTNKHFNANKTGVMQEEYNETTNIGSSAGLWKFEASNSSVNDTNPYNLTIYIYVSPSNWTTDYSTMTFNRIGNNNYTTDVHINFTVKNNSLDGSYEGYIQYLDNNGAGIKIPISLNVRTPMLVVNNSLSSMTTTINENYGVNHTRSINFFLNNTGYYNLGLILTSSSGILTCFSGCSSGYFANLIYNQTTSINDYTSQVLNVTITYNSSIPVGIYEGWILINGSNSSVSLSSHPYETFNLTLRLNLTRDLDVRNFDIVSVDGDKIVGNSSENETVTVKLNIYYINGGNDEVGDVFTTSNFTIWLIHKNMSSYRIPPTTGGLNLSNGTNPIYYNSYYSLNATVPANKLGGIYDVHVVANYTKSVSAVYGGEVVNQTLVINNSALKLTCVSCPSSLTNGSSSVYNISVKNYGWATAYSEKIRFIKGTRISSVTSPGNSCPVDDKTLENITLTSIGANGTICYVWWTIIASATAGDGTSTVQGTIATYFESSLSIPITVTSTTTEETTTTVSSSEDGNDQTAATTTTTVPAVKYLNITSYPSTVSVAQGTNKTVNVTVKNIHNLTQKVKLTILTINSTWYSIYPSSEVTILNKTSYTYNVTFMIPENETVKDYSGKFFAESSYGGSTQTFTLKIIPGAKLQSQISVNLSNYQTEIQDLEKELNETKNKNNTEAKNLFNQLKEKFSQASNYYNQSDYRSAYDLLDDIESLLNQTKTALSGGTVGGKGIGTIDWKGLGKWIIVAVVAVVAIVLGYLFWPTSGGFKPLKGYSPQPKKEDKKTIITGQFDKLKEKWKKAQESKE